MENLKTVIIAPDPLARVGLEQILFREELCNVVGAVDGSADWLELIDTYQPEIILCDLGWHNSLILPNVEELELPVVALVGDEEGAKIAWQAGIHGIIGREKSADTIVSALNATFHGLTTIDPRYLMLKGVSPVAIDPLVDPLTTREEEVLGLVSQGLTNRAIAHQLHISEHTVKFHLNSVLTKLGVQSRTEAVVKATQRGLLSL